MDHIPLTSIWTEEPGGLQSVWLQRVRHDGACTHTHTHTHAHAHTHTHTHTHTYFKSFSNVYIVSKALTFPRVKGDMLLGLVDDSNLVLLAQKLCIRSIL